MPISSLPPEILLIIFRWSLNYPWSLNIPTSSPFDELWTGLTYPEARLHFPKAIEEGAVQTRIALGLVCVSWRRATREMAYEHVVISALEDDTNGKLEGALTNPEQPMGRFVKRLDIHCPTRYDEWYSDRNDQFEKVLQACSKLKILLVIGHGEECIPEPFVLAIANCASSVQYLNWMDYDREAAKEDTEENNDIYFLAENLHKFQALQLLSLTIDPYNDAAYESMSAVHLPHLHSFWLVGPEAKGDDCVFLSWVARWTLPSLSNVSWYSRSRIGSGMSFFENFGVQIEA
jgi:hypothetical protein